MTIDSNGDNGNGKVTLAVIGTKLDRIFDWMKELERCQQDNEHRLNALENGQATRVEQIHVLKEEVKNLRAKSETWAFVNSVGTIVAGILGGLGLGK